MKFRMALIAMIAFLFPLLAQAIGVGDPAQVNWKGKWYDAVVRDVSGTRLLIHYNGYDNSWDEWVTMDRVKIQVSWKGKWYPATALKSSKGQVLIHYTGYDNSWDEWVPLSRIASYGASSSRRPAVPSHVRDSAAGVPSDPQDFLDAIKRNSGR